MGSARSEEETLAHLIEFEELLAEDQARKPKFRKPAPQADGLAGRAGKAQCATRQLTFQRVEDRAMDCGRLTAYTGLGNLLQSGFHLVEFSNFFIDHAELFFRQ